MDPADRSRFVYVTYLRTTPATLWEALTEPRLVSQYWFNTIVECGWKKGSPWKMSRADGSPMDTGEILEIDPPRRITIRWHNEWNPDLKAEGPSRCTYELEPVHQAVKLTVTNEMDRPESKLIAAVSRAWPHTGVGCRSLPGVSNFRQLTVGSCPDRGEI